MITYDRSLHKRRNHLLTRRRHYCRTPSCLQHIGPCVVLIYICPSRPGTHCLQLLYQNDLYRFWWLAASHPCFGTWRWMYFSLNWILRGQHRRSFTHRLVQYSWYIGKLQIHSNTFGAVYPFHSCSLPSVRLVYASILSPVLARFARAHKCESSPPSPS